jgi:MFS family permease
MATDPRFLPPSPFSRLVTAHAVSMCGDAAIAASLAGSLFFSTPTDSSREKVLLYLLVTMLPFAIVAPVLGPALDYRRSGRRVLIAVSMLGRGVLALLMARWVSDPAPAGLLVYPLAFGILVLAKGYSVAKSALVPALIGRDDELVRANSRLALVSAIATTVGGAPAFVVQEVFGPEWSLRFAFVFFALGTVLALKIPSVRLAQTAREAQLEREEMHQPSILLAGSAMALIRGAVGFLAFFAAFSLKDDLFALGIAAAMAVTGGFVGNIVGPHVRRALREEQMLAAALLVTASFVLLGTLLSTTLAFAVSSLAVAIGAATGRLGFDSLLQRDGPDAARGRAFAQFETRFQVAWVVGALIGIIPQNVTLGLLLLAVALALGGASYVAARRAARGREMRTTLRPPAVDRAVGRAADGLRARVRAQRRRGRRSPQAPHPAQEPDVELE